MITTIIFDLSDVYLHGASGAWKHLQRKIDTKLTDEHLLIAELNQLFIGEITEDVYWRIVIKKNAWKNISVNDLKDAVRKNFKEISGTRKIIEQLKQKDFRLGLLSNNAKEWVEYCEINYKYHKLFDVVLYSCEVGISKPNKDIFKLILKKLKAKSRECLFIDDYIKNISSANEMGINIIHFKVPTDLKKKLREFKIFVD